ncbi:DUF4326 domain-containing protein [Streptomyces sp. Ag82_G6-1]|uniref:DUF4326 domain-containing protein n=1 Tax=Streptomyces sp. Ag82_G6-1 TaxID=1938853 RepID=UPI00269367CB
MLTVYDEFAGVGGSSKGARELPALRGRRLGCWCGPEQPCHARVLAELADRAVKP